jgi:hypothetical protein
VASIKQRLFSNFRLYHKWIGLILLSKQPELAYRCSAFCTVYHAWTQENIDYSLYSLRPAWLNNFSKRMIKSIIKCIVCLIFMCQLNQGRGHPEADETLLLGVSLKTPPDEIRLWVIILPEEYYLHLCL